MMSASSSRHRCVLNSGLNFFRAIRSLPFLPRILLVGVPGPETIPHLTLRDNNPDRYRTPIKLAIPYPSVTLNMNPPNPGPTQHRLTGSAEHPFGQPHLRGTPPKPLGSAKGAVHRRVRTPLQSDPIRHRPDAYRQHPPDAATTPGCRHDPPDAAANNPEAGRHHPTASQSTRLHRLRIQPRPDRRPARPTATQEARPAATPEATPPSLGSLCRLIFLRICRLIVRYIERLEDAIEVLFAGEPR